MGEAVRPETDQPRPWQELARRNRVRRALIKIHPDSIGGRIQAARKAMGWTRVQLAEAVDLSPFIIEDIEDGWLENFDLRWFACIARALEVSMDELYWGREK
jgi:DNA-binding XRE family transcriptional regulator